MSLRTDLLVTPLPSPLPNWGGLKGANIIQTDPDFGTRIVRITDAATNANGTVQTADTSESGMWNKDATLLFVGTTGGASILYSFNPTTLQGAKVTLPHFGGQVVFSGVQPNVFYQLQKSKIDRVVLTNTNGVYTVKA